MKISVFMDDFMNFLFFCKIFYNKNIVFALHLYR